MRQEQLSGADGRGVPVQHYLDNSWQSSRQSTGGESWKLSDPWSQADSPFESHSYSAGQSYGAGQSSSAGRSYSADQNYGGSQEYGTSQTYNTDNGGWHQFGDFRDRNGVAIQDYRASLNNDGNDLDHDTGSGWPECYRDRDDDWNGRAFQNHDASHSHGHDLNNDKANGDWHKFHGDRDPDLDRNGHASKEYGKAHSDNTGQRHDVRQSSNARAFDDVGQRHGESPDYGTGKGRWRELRGDRDKSRDWNRDALQPHDRRRSDSAVEEFDACQGRGERREHDTYPSHEVSQNYGVSTDYGDSLDYVLGDGGWHGFDAGVKWDGTALRNRDAARREEGLRNRGEGWCGGEFGGGVRKVDGWADADRVGDGPAGSVERAGRKRGAHRVPAPPRALKGRAAVIAVAAGAVVAVGQNLVAGSEKSPQTAELQAVGQQQALEPVSGELPTTPELLDTATPTSVERFSDVLENGDKFAQDLAAEVEAKLRPLFMKFASGTFTSGYGERWGVLHPGVDVAAPIGTPIYAVEDGTVIDAGPAAGFGMWVRMRGDDGTITVYGHINTALVSVGQHVLAGDEIATVGNRGESTGPHCHFEVWLNGTDRIDPLPWLATRGISLGPERD